jgi:arylsulfatase A-like enzyme
MMSRRRRVRGTRPMRRLLLLGIGLLAGAFFLLSPRKETPPTLLLISIDTLRADRLGSYGNEFALTPCIDRLARESVVFDRAFAPASFTVPSVSSMLTGWYPEQNGIFSNESILPRNALTLAGLFAMEEVRTGAVVSNFVLRSGTGLARDFEIYDERFGDIETGRPVPERTARATTDAALTVLDQLGEDPDDPVFLWVHYQDPHGPYTPPEEERALLLSAERELPGGSRRLPFGEDHRGLGEIPNYQRIADENEVAFYRAGYHAEIRLCDREIGRLLDGLRARERFEDAVIILTADHGEGLGEREYWFAHGEHLTDPIVRVPLMIRAPGLVARRRGDTVSLLDLVPTLAERFGLRTPAGLPGRDLLAPDADRSESEVYLATLRGSKLPRVGLVKDGYKYILTREEDGTMREELFSLGEEERDLGGGDPARLAEMRRRMQQIRERVANTVSERRQQMTDEELEAMDKLGY